MWHLYGKHYDLHSFMQHHPGGKHILEATKGLEDITALFETYHAFSNIENVQKTLTNYEIPMIEKEIPYPYDFTNYRSLVKKMKELYPNRKTIKSNEAFLLQMIGTVSILCVSFYCTYVSSIPLYMKCFSQVLYSATTMSLGFNLMHDGSHYGIFLTSCYNEWFSKIINNSLFWNSKIWFYHHVYLHHSNTGLKHDPDIQLYIKPNFITTFTSFMILYILFPGQLVAQGLSYCLVPFKNMFVLTNNVFYFASSQDTFPDIYYYDFMDLFIMGVQIYWFYQAGFMLFCIHTFVINFLYFINIYPNHSLYETKIENKYQGKDWVKMQIMHSGNFVNNNTLWTRIFGGINFQIEHHLFPNMSNIHYPKIAPIVKQYCKENNIPYVHHDTIYSAFQSFKKTVNHVE